MTVPESSNVRRRLQEEEEEEEESDGGDGEGESQEDEVVNEEVGEDISDGGEDQEESEELEDADDEVPIVSAGDSNDVDEEDSRVVFGMKGDDVEEVVAGDKKRGDSSDRDDDEVQQLGEEPGTEDAPAEERDFSHYDSWMGVLSASSVKYFVRIVPSSEVGVISLHDYEKSKLER